MSPWFIGLVTALWLGILMSISPCPLATNIAAISFISKQVDKPRYVFWTGLLYTLGRTLVYTVIGALLVASLLSTPVLSRWLQKYMNALLGPLLVVMGLFILEFIQFGNIGAGIGQRAQKWAEKGSVWMAFVLGVLFALSFCPVSAVLFFGNLLAIAIKLESSILVPAVFGVGSALPVIIFSFLIALGANWISSAFKQVQRFEFYARRITGVLFILVGIYLSLEFTLDVI
ncbi:MAG: aromatic aminobenezylarsenical efflux permease ArsG family transporter [Candidatus Sumerlaeia bacterium]